MEERKNGFVPMYRQWSSGLFVEGDLFPREENEQTSMQPAGRDPPSDF